MKEQEKIEDNVIIGINEKGQKQTFNKLLEFTSEEDGCTYVVYTDYAEDEHGNYKAYASKVVNENNEIKLEEVTNKKVWEFIEMTLSTIEEEKQN